MSRIPFHNSESLQAGHRRSFSSRRSLTMASLKQFSWLLWAVSLAFTPALGAPADPETAAAKPKVPVQSDFTTAQVTNGEALTYLSSFAKNSSDALLSKPKARRAGTCSPGNLRIRQEWRTLSKAQRKSYIAAVKCLRTKPSLLDSATFPGSVSLFDDFVAIHLMQTLNIHLSVGSHPRSSIPGCADRVKGIFLTWHRYFTWAYEEKLRTECGYTGEYPSSLHLTTTDRPRHCPVLGMGP